MKLTRDERAWRRQRIREAYPDGDLQRLADELGMTAAALRKTAQRLGVRREELAVSRTKSAAVSHRKRHCSEERQRLAQVYEAKKKVPSPQQEAALPVPDVQPSAAFIPFTKLHRQHNEKIKAEYPERRGADLAVETGLNYYTVVRKANRMGVGKSPSFMHQSWVRGAKHGWKIKGEQRKALMRQYDEYMRAHFATTKNLELARLFGVDEKTVRRWARRLGLQKSEAFMQEARGRGCVGHRTPYYTPEHLAWRRQRIADVYPDGSEDELLALAEELGVTRNHVGQLAARYGIHRSEERTHEARKAGMVRCGRTKFTPEVIAALAEYYPTHTNEECAEHFGLNKGSINQVAVKHGWKKTREHKSRVYSQSMAAYRQRERENKIAKP